jgi:hypothetical protein
MDGAAWMTNSRHGGWWCRDDFHPPQQRKQASESLALEAQCVKQIR